MGMSMHVVGVRPPDGKWLAMKAAFDACTAAKVPVPREVNSFFGDSQPDPKGVVVSKADLIACGAVQDFSGDGKEGFTINVKSLPADVVVVRVFNQW